MDTPQDPPKPRKKDFCSATDAERDEAFRNAKPFHVVGPNEKAPEAEEPSFPTVSFADIQPAEWEYATDRVWPLGEVSNLEGYGGDGKSCVMIDHEARATRGLDLPDGMGLGEPSGVIHFSTEESPRKTIVKRLRAAGADLRFVRNVDLAALAKEHRDPKFKDTPGFRFPSGAGRLNDTIRRVSMEMGVPVKLVAFDGVLSTLDLLLEMNNSQHVRAYLDSLRQVAVEQNVAIVLIRHPSKARMGLAAQRGAGAGAFHDFVRVSWLVGREPGTKHEEFRRVFVPLKRNAPIRKGLLFTTHWDEQHSEAAVEWGKTCEIDPEEVYAAREERASAPPAKVDEAHVELVLKALHGSDPYSLTPKQAANKVEGSGVSKEAIWAALERMKEARKGPAKPSAADLRSGEKPDDEGGLF